MRKQLFADVFGKSKLKLTEFSHVLGDIALVFNDVRIDQNELIAKIELLNEYEEMMEEIKNEAEAIRDEIKAEMLAENTEEMIAGQYIIRWTSILSTRFDSTAFKKVMPDVYKAYTKQISSRRFTITA